MNNSITTLLNLSLRSINLGTKFVLVIFLAKLLSMEEFGVYGLLTALINFSLYLIGLDFYTYSNRELINAKNSTEKNKIISSHLNIVLILYVVTLPLLSLIFFKQIIPLDYIILFYAILISEHINQEIMRLLIIYKSPVISSLLFFIRSSSWVFIIIVLTFLSITTSLQTILAVWLIAQIITLILGMYTLYKLKVHIKIQSLDILWIKKGLKICVPFLLGTLAVRGIFTVDKYYIDFFFNQQILAAYILFSSLTAATLSFMDAAVNVFEYPTLVKQINNREESYRITLKRFYKKTVIFLLLINILSVILIKYLLVLINKSDYLIFLNYFYLLTLVQTIYCLSMVPHYVLYALNEDKIIITSHITALVIFITLLTILEYFNHSAANIFTSLISSFTFLLIFKFFKSKNLLKIYEYSNFSKSSKEL